MTNSLIFKRHFIALALAVLPVLAFAQVKVGDNPTILNGSASLEVESTSKGFLPPRMTDAQMNAISSPAEGLLVYCTNCTPKDLHFFNGTGWSPFSGTLTTVGSIASLDCSSVTEMGLLLLDSGVPASGVSVSVPYISGNGGAHNGQAVSSTGVSGLTATLGSGSFANGDGSLVYTITGTPSGGGTASFALDIGGQSCTLALSVATP